MRRHHALAGVLAGVLAVLLVAAPVAAGGTTGKSVLLGAPTSGTTLQVDVSVTSSAPVVAYQYAIQNECTFPGRSGSSYQRDDIVYWTFEVDGVPHAVMPVYLQTVPVGSSCKVFIAKGNVAVKGSTTLYTVQ